VQAAALQEAELNARHAALPSLAAQTPATAPFGARPDSGGYTTQATSTRRSRKRRTGTKKNPETATWLAEVSSGKPNYRTERAERSARLQLLHPGSEWPPDRQRRAETSRDQHGRQGKRRPPICAGAASGTRERHSPTETAESKTTVSALPGEKRESR